MKVKVRIFSRDKNAIASRIDQVFSVQHCGKSYFFLVTNKCKSYLN